VTLGLIANELLLNSLKHGFAGREMGRLSLELHEDDQIQMSVRDDGCGLPPGFDGGKNAGLGTELIHGMTRQLGGRAEIVREPAGGTRATIRFRSTANSKQRLT
jgi:two-component sensor histidine kinase